MIIRKTFQGQTYVFSYKQTYVSVSTKWKRTRSHAKYYSQMQHVAVRAAFSNETFHFDCIFERKKKLK